MRIGLVIVAGYCFVRLGFSSSLLLNLLLPTNVLTVANPLLSRLTFGTTAVYVSWFVLSVVLLYLTWRDYRRTTFPWHANRLLFWVIALFITFVGELLTFFDISALHLAGQIIRFVGTLALIYAVASYRIFDVRTRSQRIFAFTIITLIASLPFIGAVLLVEWLRDVNEWSLSTTFFLLGTIITLAFFLYLPFRRFVERVSYRYFLDEGIDTNKVVRGYSQAISRTLDVNQLSLVIIATLNELLGTTRGALMLVSREQDGYQVEPIPAMGSIPQQTMILPDDTPFIHNLLHQQQPVLQYDIDFSRDYSNLSQLERDWFRELAMEAYVPVITDGSLNGLIVIGPKGSSLPYQPGELALMQTLADQTVVALQNARLYSEMGRQNEQINQLNIDLVSQNERLEIMDKVKSDFITIASHELRTPLTQVKGYSDILSAMNDENMLTREQTREIIGHINRATSQLEHLITAMLDASQLDVAAMQLTFVQTNVDMIIRLATEPLLQALKQRQITLTANGLDNLPPIQADFKRLVQSFQNLLGNAVKYTPDHGQIVVEAELLQGSDEEGDYIEIVISDSGIGIDSKYHELIFEKFFRIGDPQLHSTGSTKFKGAGPGLGLPIAKGVIEAHDGRIWVESDGEDEERLPGSHFHIILPVIPPNAEEKSASNNGQQKQAEERPSWLIG